MSQVHHIEKNKDLLEMRANIIRLIRKFFWLKNFIEIDSPSLVKLPGQEPYLSPMKLEIHNERGDNHPVYLHTSPEYAMKKSLAAGFENIFYLGKCFRDYESFGGLHSPEFTMLEWYRKDKDMESIMDDCESLFTHVVTGLSNQINSKEYYDTWERMHMKDIWKKYVAVDLDEYLNKESLKELCREKGFQVEDDEAYEDLFYRIFLNLIEPHLGKDKPTIIHHYPAQMAALAKLDDNDSRYAERFEIYIKGVELANAFSELCDPIEQRKRLEEERLQRQKLGKEIYSIDEEFVQALEHIDSAAGIALGVDRMVQVLTGCKDITDVILLPMKKNK